MKKTTKSVSGVLALMRDKLRPEKAPAVALRFLTELQRALPRASVMAGGSFAKGTHLRDTYDIDVFARFPPLMSDEEMARVLKKALPKAAVLHGSRDYLQIKRGGFVFEIVPVRHITHWRDVVNVTDMSPLHVEYVASHLSLGQKDDVRVAKQFCKAAGVYGAESYVRGFSGYVLELMIEHYGSFEELLRASQSWNEPVVIDHARHYPNAQSALNRLNEAKILAPIILIDPLQPDRNAAAALTHEKYNRFICAAREFLAAPSVNVFDIKITPAKIKSRYSKQALVIVKVNTPKGKHDIIGCELLSQHEYAVRLLEESEFAIVDYDFRFGEKITYAWYALEKEALPKETEQRGPPDSMKEAVAAFVHVHKERAFVKNGRWYAPIPRAYVTAAAAVKAGWKGSKLAITTTRPKKR